MDEETHLKEVAGRLSSLYPALLVQELHTRFDGVRIREFVPLFVERRAHTALTELDGLGTVAGMAHR